MSRVDKFNRALWSALGLLLLCAGSAGLLISNGAVDAISPRTPLLWSWAAQTWRAGGVGTAALVVLFGLLLLAIGALLMKAQLHLPSSQAPALRFGDAQAGGITELRPAALPKALERDLRRVPGVSDASVRLEGDDNGMSARIQLELTGTARMQLVVPAVQRCLDRFAETIGVPVERAAINLAVRPEPAPARVS